MMDDIDSELYTQLVTDCRAWKKLNVPRRVLQTTYLLDEDCSIVSVGRSVRDPERPYKPHSYTPQQWRTFSEADAILRLDGCLRDYAGKLTAVNIKLDASGTLVPSFPSRNAYYMLRALEIEKLCWVNSEGNLQVMGRHGSVPLV